MDGDTDSPTVQHEFERIVRQEIQSTLSNGQILNVKQLDQEIVKSVENFREQIQEGGTYDLR